MNRSSRVVRGPATRLAAAAGLYPPPATTRVRPQDRRRRGWGMPEADRSVRTSSSRTSSGAPPSSTPHRSAAARSAWTWHTSLRVSSSPGAPRCRAASPRGGHRAGSRRVCSAWGSSRCSNPRWFSPVSGGDGAWGCMVGPAASRGGGSAGGRFRTQASRVCPAQPRAAGRMTAGTTPTEVVVNRRRAELQIRVGDPSSGNRLRDVIVSHPPNRDRRAAARFLPAVDLLVPGLPLHAVEDHEVTFRRGTAIHVMPASAAPLRAASRRGFGAALCTR